MLSNEEFLYPELSYKIKACFFEIRNEYGPGQKESVYQNLVLEWFNGNNIKSVKEPVINIYSVRTNKKVGVYRPDILVDDKILVELKSAKFTSNQDEKQLYFYLRNSQYELGYLVNFSTPKIFIKRIVYSNSRKPFLQDK